MCECSRVNRLQSIQGFIVAARRGEGWLRVVAAHRMLLHVSLFSPSLPSTLYLYLFLSPIRVSLYIHLNPRDPTRKQDIHGNREREREKQIEIDRGEKERKGGHCYLHKPALASVGDIGALVSSVQRERRERHGGGGGKVDLLRDHRRRWRKRRRRRISGTRAPIGAEERIWQTAKDRDVWMFERQSAEAALELPSPLSPPLFLRFSSGRPPTLYRDTTGVHSYLTLIKRRAIWCRC